MRPRLRREELREAAHRAHRPPAPLRRPRPGGPGYRIALENRASLATRASRAARRAGRRLWTARAAGAQEFTLGQVTMRLFNTFKMNTSIHFQYFRGLQNDLAQLSTF